MNYLSNHQSPPPRRRVSLWRILGTLMGIMGAYLTLTIVFIMLFQALGMPEILTIFFSYLISISLVMIPLIMLHHRLHLNLNFSLPKLKDLGLILLLFLGRGLIMFIIILLVSQFVNFDDVNPDSPLTELEDTGWVGVFVSLSILGILVPLFEEIVFRGYLFSQLRRRWSFMRAAVCSSVIFALLHLNMEANWQTNFVAITSIFVLSLGISYAFERTQTLWSAVIFHALNNIVVIGWAFLRITF